MKTKLLALFFLLATYAISAQVVERVEVLGKIVVEQNDIEGVTVYNSSSNKGTTTNEKGEFKIEVALNDEIQFGALQFKDFKITIDKNVIESKKLTVFLVEQVNKLDEILILPYDLSGNLETDLKSVQTFNPNMDAIYFGVANATEYEFSDDIRSKTENIAMHSQGQAMENGLNFVNVAALLLKPLFKEIFKSNKKGNNLEAEESISYEVLKDKYSTDFLHQNFNIPTERMDEFLIYVETHGLAENMLASGNELEFLEFIYQKSIAFLKEALNED
ncbi:carboxypeptidase-like regulatory domain-containing protein [Lacinutrix undariae]